LIIRQFITEQQAGFSEKLDIEYPPSFLPACLGFAPIFFGGKLLFIFSRPCPAPPNAGDTKELPENCCVKIDFMLV
jgi:hypothetical protein